MSVIPALGRQNTQAREEDGEFQNSQGYNRMGKALSFSLSTTKTKLTAAGTPEGTSILLKKSLDKHGYVSKSTY